MATHCSAEHGNLPTFHQQPRDEMSPEKTRAAGDEGIRK